ncbi:flavodoxin family protein [bacterium]|nr:flavodoxin family protein [bacterium]
MKICVLDGNPESGGNDFKHWLGNFVDTLKAREHEIVCMHLSDVKVNTCRGCWSCWVKTPGRCVINDEMGTILHELIQADFLIMASPMLMGFPSSMMKKVMDRMVPIVKPYIEIEGGECHHIARYKNVPKIGLVLERSGDTDVEDIDITTDLFSRFARNMKTNLHFVRLTSQPVEEVCHAIERL